MRNRCVEISLLDSPPAIAVATADGSSLGGDVGVTAFTENSTDLLSLVGSAGITDPGEATAAMAVHSTLVARRCRGKGDVSSGEGPAPRSLKLWADIAFSAKSRCWMEDPLRRSLSLAYPAGGAGGAQAEGRAAEAALSTFLPASHGEELGRRRSELLEILTPCGWNEFVTDGIGSQVNQDLKVLKFLNIAAASGLGDASRALLFLVVQATGLQEGSVREKAEAPSSAVRSTGGSLSLEDERFFASVSLLSEGKDDITEQLQLHAAASFAKRASACDRHLRSIEATGLSSGRGVGLASASVNVGESVVSMMEALFDCSAWKDVSSLLQEVSLGLPEVHVDVAGGVSGGGHTLERRDGLEKSVSSARSMWSPHDPRANPDLFRSLQRACRTFPKWNACLLLMDLVDASLGRRLPRILLERSEIARAQARIRSGRGSVAGFGWLALSCLVCDGGLDAVRMGARGGGCSETRLARSALVPYLLPLLRAVDGVVDGLVCREAVEVIAKEGAAVSADCVLSTVGEVLLARDSLAGLLASPTLAVPGPDASAGGGGEMLFGWDSFLVAWQWLKVAVDALDVAVSPLRGVIRSYDVSGSWAGLKAVAARVDVAVLEHAGGTAPALDTLWERGPSAAAPASAKGALALARLRRLADEFRIVPFGEAGRRGVFGGEEGEEEAGVTLGRLMRESHPAFCVPVDVRREVLDALCTLYWIASCELGDRSVGGKTRATRSTTGSSRRNVKSGEGTAGDDDDGDSLADQLPLALETALSSAKAKFAATHKGTRLGSAQREEGIGRDDLEFGERFDDFDTEAAEAVASATLLVVSGDDPVGGDGAGGGDSRSEVVGGGVLMNWALVQLSFLREHWIAVEEGAVLALMSSYEGFTRVQASAEASAGASITQKTSQGAVAIPPAQVPAFLEAAGAEQCNASWSHEDLEALMTRVARLRSAILATPSLSPAVARPYQTILWAWGNPSAWSTVAGPLLSRLLPVAQDSFFRRLWENVVGTPAAISLNLAPPQMLSQTGSENMGRQGRAPTSAFGGCGVLEGPVQLLTLARSAFFLRLVSTACFSGGIVPGVSAQSSNPGAVDLTLMNASARLAQYRVAMRAVQALRDVTPAALKSLVAVSWSDISRTLTAFDGLKSDGDKDVGSATLFRDALRCVGDISGGRHCSDTALETTLQRATEACPDKRLSDCGQSLVLPAVQCLAKAVAALSGGGEGPSRRTEATAGLGMALLGSLKLVLLLPSSPVDPGLRPALQKSQLEERLDGVKGALTVRRWSLRLEGGGDVSPEASSCCCRRHLQMTYCILVQTPLKEVAGFYVIFKTFFFAFSFSIHILCRATSFL